MCLNLQETFLSHVTHAQFNNLTECRFNVYMPSKIGVRMKILCRWTHRLTSTMCVEKPAWDIWRPNAVPFLLVPADKDNINTQEKRVHHFLQQSIADFSGLKERVGTENIAKRCGINLKIWSNVIYSVGLCRDFTGWGFGLCYGYDAMLCVVPSW